nr:MAG TPA: hypothetical protein [Bacteriophage sp.]
MGHYCRRKKHTLILSLHQIASFRQSVLSSSKSFLF